MFVWWLIQQANVQDMTHVPVCQGNKTETLAADLIYGCVAPAQLLLNSV